MRTGTYFPGRGTLVEESYLKGRATERAVMILFLLEKRGVAVPTDVRQRITDCADLELLKRWRERAFTVTDVKDLFSDD